MAEKTIYIVGLGLIGGSLALGIKRDHPEYRVVGYNRSEKSRQIAIERGLVDEMTDDFASFVPEADVIIICVPIKQTIELIRILGTLPLKEGVIITDAGSTKLEIVLAAEKYLASTPAVFVGSHPMAGSHKSGAIASDVNLFENAYYIFTPSSLTKEDTIPHLKQILSGLHARFIEVDAAEHDRVTAQISHFPHVLAATLMEQSATYSETHELTRHFAAGGFRDMTRIAESEPGMWTSILLSNQEAILERLENFQSGLATIAEKIRNSDSEGIWAFFEHARLARQEMEIHKRGGVDSTYDLQVSIPDEEDEILNVLELLRGTSLVNVQILENNREDINGILRISFKNQKDLDYARSQIETYTPHQVSL